MTLQLIAGPVLTCTLYVRHIVSSYHTAAIPGVIDPEPQWITRQRRWFCGCHEPHILVVQMQSCRSLKCSVSVELCPEKAAL